MKTTDFTIELPIAHLLPYLPWPGSESLEQWGERRRKLFQSEAKLGTGQPPAGPKTTTGPTPGPVGPNTTEGPLPHVKVPGVKTTYGSVPKPAPSPSPSTSGPKGTGIKPKV
jgi:hypothetical protein